MLIKVLIVAVIIAILVSLAMGQYFLVRDKSGESRRTVKALTVRIVLTVTLLALLIIGIFTGAIEPHGLGQ